MAAPRASTAAPTSRVALGLTVLMSTYTAPGRRPATRPSAPRATARRASGSVTMLNTTSAAVETARGESASRIPRSTSGLAFSRVRL